MSNTPFIDRSFLSCSRVAGASPPSPASVFPSEAHRARFPGLALAWETLEGQAGSTVVLNAANEVAVELFLKQRIRFDQIHAVNLAALSLTAPKQPKNLEDLLNIDSETRVKAFEIAKKLL